MEVSYSCTYKSEIEIRYTQLYDIYEYSPNSYSLEDYYSYSSSTNKTNYYYKKLYTYYFKIELTSSANYLVITPHSSSPYSCEDSFLVQHARKTRYFWLYLILGIMAPIIIIAIIIYYVKKKPNYPNVIVDQLVTNNQTIYPPETQYIPPQTLPQQPNYQSNY